MREQQLEVVEKQKKPLASSQVRWHTGLKKKKNTDQKVMNPQYFDTRKLIDYSF